MTVLDNQQVTADILNGIAKDLGATTFDKFEDGTKFGVDELNSITAALVTKGILADETERCKVSVTDGKISVGTGTIVFESGAKMKLTEKQTLKMIENGNSHVVAVNDTTNNRMLLYSAESLPEVEDYVLLAKISADGGVVDERNWSCIKASADIGHYYETIKFNLPGVEYGEDNGYGGPLLVAEYQLKQSGYKVFRVSIDSNFDRTQPPLLWLIEGSNPPRFSLDGNLEFHRKTSHGTEVIRVCYNGGSNVKIYTEVYDGYSVPDNDVKGEIYFY